MNGAEVLLSVSPTTPFMFSVTHYRRRHVGAILEYAKEPVTFGNKEKICENKIFVVRDFSLFFHIHASMTVRNWRCVFFFKQIFAIFFWVGIEGMLQTLLSCEYLFLASGCRASLHGQTAPENHQPGCQQTTPGGAWTPQFVHKLKGLLSLLVMPKFSEGRPQPAQQRHQLAAKFPRNMHVLQKRVVINVECVCVRHGLCFRASGSECCEKRTSLWGLPTLSLLLRHADLASSHHPASLHARHASHLLPRGTHGSRRELCPHFRHRLAARHLFSGEEDPTPLRASLVPVHGVWVFQSQLRCAGKWFPLSV